MRKYSYILSNYIFAMQIIKNIHYWIILVILWFWVFTNFVYASTSYTSTSWRTSCNDTPTSWDNDNSGKKWIPTTNNNSAASSWNFSCTQHWYWSWNWSWYQNKNNIYNCPNNEYASKINCYDSSNNSKTCTSDWSWWVKYKIYCKKRDDTSPTWSDLSSNPNDDSYLKAYDSQNITITAGANWWSPIVKIKWEYEKYNSPSNYNSEKVSDNDNNSSTKDKLETTENISLVDNNREVNNYRIYNYKITQVCDEAWNCTSNPRTFKYNVYAWDIDSWNSSITWLDNLDSWKVAEAIPYQIKTTLKDSYWNAIVPVDKSDWTNIRKIWIDIAYDNNNFYLDQYKKSWTTAVSMSWFTDSNFVFTSNWTHTFNYNSTSTWFNNWVYYTKIKVYNPTQNTYNKAYWNFKINSFSWKTYDSSNNIDSNLELASAIDFKFNPIYKTKINWDLEKYGFIEWITQSWSINLTKDSSATKSPTGNIYLEFGSWARLSSSKLDLKANSWSTWKFIREWYNSSWLVWTIFNWVSSFNLFTQLIQKAWTILKWLQDQYLSTHIKYVIDWKTVVYNSDIIWKNNYWENTNSWNTVQNWLKVLWLTYSKKQEDIINNQDINDIHVLGNITKASVKKDFRSNVFSVLKTINWWTDWKILNLDSYDWNSNTDWFKMYDDKVLYFDVNWKTIVLWDWWDKQVKWIKTIVIKWWDLYIKSNMYYSDSLVDDLWIVILKDKNWKWGNLYIDPTVTHIVWSIFVDKVILTAKDWYYDWTIDWEISSNEILWIDAKQKELANQLFIKWQIFSENTIWGSRKNPVVCPYFIKNSQCNLKTSQLYDLNYLRRYFIYDSNNNWYIDNNDIAANWWKNYKSTFDTSVYKYARYPVVIEYNSIIQLLPPPLFD